MALRQECPLLEEILLDGKKEGRKERRKGGRGLVMEDDTSNDVEAVEYIDSQDEEDNNGGEKRPIMILLRRLIRNKQNTVMTNAQIINILESEFNISVKTSHELEVDIYIKIIKKYLKDWPQWEELERISTKLSNIKDYEAVSKVLNHKYKNLKEYLGIMLELSKPLAKEAVRSVTAAPEISKPDENLDSSDVVMEIQCTRDQLNHLFFRQPRSDLNNTVFNMSKIPPSRISLKHLSYEQILNGWWVKVYINLPHFIFVREVYYKLKHVLVNKVRNENFTESDITLDTGLKLRPCNYLSKKTKTYTKEEVISQFSEIIKECKTYDYDQLHDIMVSLFNILKSELEETDYKIPANFRRYANRYKYVRYLYADNGSSHNDPRYDLQLEETVSPLYFYYIGKIGQLRAPLSQTPDWIKVECMFCKMKLPGNMTLLKEIMESHFNEYHQNEMDWQCTHCKRLFSIDFLANNKWCHEC